MFRIEMSQKIKLTREQILEDNYLEDLDVGDSSDEEIDKLEINEESDEDDEQCVEEEGPGFKVPEIPGVLTIARIARSETVEMLAESNLNNKYDDDDVNQLYKGRAKKDLFEWNSKQYNLFLRQPEFPATFLPKAVGAISIVDFFNLIFDTNIISKIVSSTNLRIRETEGHVSENEILSFIGLLILFGLTNKTNVDVAEIWSPDSIHYMQ
jgi:hypothetical protein